LSGWRPLDRHIHGGVPVDAEISQPLLLSIFHPKSPGHDGAILIENDRITSLGVHLPLTKQVDKVHDCGTRHAAALGLAEGCDAFVVAVSEERGTITIVQDGELTEVEATLSGPEPTFSMLDATTLAVSLEIEEQNGKRFGLESRDPTTCPTHGTLLGQVQKMFQASNLCRTTSREGRGRDGTGGPLGTRFNVVMSFLLSS